MSYKYLFLANLVFTQNIFLTWLTLSKPRFCHNIFGLGHYSSYSLSHVIFLLSLKNGGLACTDASGSTY
jgi:hypothetical protein